MKKIIFLIATLLLLTACREGKYVDKVPGSYVDPITQGGFEKEMPAQNTTVNDTNSTVNQEINITINETTNDTDNDTKEYTHVPSARAWAKIWAWNKYGSQLMYVAEGSGAYIKKLHVNISVRIITSDGRASILVDGVPAPVMHVDDEKKVNNTWLRLADTHTRD